MERLGIVARGLAVLALAACGPSQEDRLAQAEKRVAERLKDPDAATFQHLAICPADHGIISGEFDEKNGKGEYDGFAPFYIVDGIPVLSSEYRYDASAEVRYRYFRHVMDLCTGTAENRIRDYDEFRRAYEAGAIWQSPLSGSGMERVSDRPVIRLRLVIHSAESVSRSI